jgi:non-specific serine/threonine protein kinase
LATSRQPLGIAGETTWRVPSLPLPDLLRLPPLENLKQYEAVRLFIERAAAAKPDFSVTNRNAPSVAQICHRLDGIPLAIELAAARVKVLPVHQIAARPDNRFHLLTGGSRTTLPRQQTLRATMDWSYDLLPEDERTLLRRLAVFAGGWTLDAAEAVCGAGGIEPAEVLDLLTRLLDKSLVMALVTEGATGEAWYWQLETVRQYAIERLREAGEESALRRRHRDFFMGFAERAGSELLGTDQTIWLGRLKAEIDNLRAALEWSRHDPGDEDAGLRLAGGLWWFWFTQGTLTEGRAWLEGALAASAPTQSLARGGALYGAGAIAWLQGDMRRATELAQEALGMCRDLGDRLGVVYSLCILGVIPMIQGEYDRAIAMFEEGLALSRELGRRWETATVLGLLGWAGRYRGDFERAATLSAESLTLFRNAGDQWGMASALSHLGSVTGRLGDLAKAKVLLAESVQLARGLGNRPQLAVSLHELGRVALAQGAHDEATELEREALALRRDQGEMWGIAECLEGLAAVARAQGRPERAAHLIGAAEVVREAVGVPLPAADRADYEQDLIALRGALGDQVFSAVREQGWTVALDTVVEDALTGSRAPDR